MTDGRNRSRAQPAKRARRRVLAEFDGGEAVLSYYPAGHVMAEHSHDCDQRSIILAGALAEETPGASVTLSALHAGFKAAGQRHQNRYGPNGALILALNCAPRTPSGPTWRWRSGVDAAPVRTLVSALCAEAGNAADVDALIADLLALGAPPLDPAAPPRWLRRLRALIEAEPQAASVQALADVAGVHRVYLARAYKAAYGAPISLDRRRFQTAQALRALLEDGASPAEAAAQAGFSDQPHFTRSLKADAGLTPGRLACVLQSAA